MLRAISLRESWMREIRTSGLTRERAPNGRSLLYTSIFEVAAKGAWNLREVLQRSLNLKTEDKR